MGIIPSKLKYRKYQRGKRRGVAMRGSQVNFGEFGLQCLECGWLKVKQIESARRALTHYLKRGGKVWIRLTADKPVTARAAETRMGSGKGAPEYNVAVVRPGMVLFELGGVEKSVALEALHLAGYKLPVKTRVVAK